MRHRIAALAVLVLISASPAWADVVRVDLRLDKAMVGGKAQDWTRTAYLSLTLQDGKAVSGKIGAVKGGGVGGWNIIAWTARVDGVDVRHDGDKLVGTIRAKVASNDVAAGEYAFAIDGQIKDGKVSGTFAAKCGDAAGKGSLSGEAKTLSAPVVVDPKDSIYTLVLEKAMPRGEALKVYLDRKGGQFRAAFACAPPFSRRPYEIDASGLTLKDGEIVGTIKVLRNISRTKIDPFLGSFEIKAKLRGTEVRGSHHGTFTDEKGAGEVWGETISRVDVPKEPKVWVKLEDGLFGGADWQNRAFFNFMLTGGKADMGKLFNNKGVYKGRLDRAELTLDGTRVKGTMNGTILSGGVAAGAYTFELDGTMIGDVLVGHFTTRHGDKVKQGYFVGGFGP